MSTEDIIKWYEDTCCNDSFNDVATLMRMRGLLVTRCQLAGTDYASLMKKHRKAKFEHELRMKRRLIELTAQNDNASGKVYTIEKAKAIALSENATAALAIAEEEGMIDGWQIWFRQTNAVLDAMRQDIAEMRKLRDND